MIADLILWGHALAALLFGALALWTVRGHGVAGLPRAPLAIALALTALWALSVAGIGGTEPVTRLVGGLRGLGWLALLFLAQRDRGRRPATVSMAYAAVALVTVAFVVLYVVADASDRGGPGSDVDAAALLLRTLVATASLVLLHRAYPALASVGARLALAAGGALWLIEANVSFVHYLTGTSSPELIAARGPAVAIVAGVVAVALQRPDGRTPAVSRTATVQSLSLLALVAYLLATVAATSGLAAIGGAQARIVQTAFVFGSTAALLTLLSSPWLRAWAKVKLAKHLFRHRYDYRVEWTRFTQTLGAPDEGAPLSERVVKAVADLTDSPAGLLLVADEDGLVPACGWRWPVAGVPVEAEATLARHLIQTGRVVELDALRTGSAPAADVAAVPRWMLAQADAWIVVPLPHLGRLTGGILLARPPIDRALDWEDFDLLRIAGRQVASYLAEARAHEALAEAKRFDEFTRRFAFILHDIKNLVSQVSLVARNAERHADNPAFRADMVATLNETAERMHMLLARLSQRHHTRGDDLRTVEVGDLLARISASRRAQHPIVVEAAALAVRADPARLEQVLGHLVQNAVEASANERPVLLRAAGDGDQVAIDVVDHGCGMSAQFVRERLFKPFDSSKPTGFGIGAFEARQLVGAMGGRIEVTSREGEGTRFRILLPAAAIGETAEASGLEQAA